MAAVNMAIVNFVYPKYFFKPCFELSLNWKIFPKKLHFYNLLIIFILYIFIYIYYYIIYNIIYIIFP